MVQKICVDVCHLVTAGAVSFARWKIIGTILLSWVAILPLAALLAAAVWWVMAS